MLGAFLLGVATKRANQAGVIAGIAVSLPAMVAVWYFTPLAWTWYVLAGTSVCTTVGYAASVVTAASREPASSSAGRPRA